MTEPLLNGPFLRTTFANFLFFLNYASFFLLPLFVKSLGGNEEVVGAAMGTAGLAAMLFLPVVAVTIDRYGPRRFFLAGGSGMVLASLGFAAIDRIGIALFALRVLQGVCFAAAFTASTTFAADLAPRTRRAQALGVFGLSTLLTHAIAPGVGEEIIHRGGFRALFLVGAGFTFLSLMMALGLPRQRRGHAPHGSVEAPGLDRVQWILAATTALAGMGFGTVMTFISTFVKGANLGRVGVFFAAYTAAAILTRAAGAGLSDSLGRRRVILPTLLGLAASIALLSTVESVGLLVVAGAFFGGSQGLSYPTLHALVVDLAPAAHLGRAQALFNGAFNLGVTGSSFVFGVVAERYGYRSMFLCASLAPLLAWVVFFFCARSGPGGSRSA